MHVATALPHVHDKQERGTSGSWDDDMGGLTRLGGVGAELAARTPARELLIADKAGRVLHAAAPEIVDARAQLTRPAQLSAAGRSARLIVADGPITRAATNAGHADASLTKAAHARGGDVAVAALQHVSDVDGYFAPAVGKRGVDLFTELGEITRDGQSTIGYNPARDAMYGWLDHTGPHKELLDLYLGRLDAKVVDRASAAAHKINAEHIWPQSNGATGAAKSDLHIIFSSDAFTNQARWHLPFGEVKTEHWRTAVTPDGTVDRVGLDVAGNLVFEPRESIRGDVARAQLYFATRYRFDQPADFTMEHFRESLPSLLKWHHADPVKAAEIARDDAIAGLQFNRNPFVRHPEWVDAIGFDSPEMRKVFEGGRGASHETVDTWDRFMQDPAGYYMAKERAGKGAHGAKGAHHGAVLLQR